MKQPDQCYFPDWMCLATVQNVKISKVSAHFVFCFVFIQTGLFPVCKTVYIYMYLFFFCITESFVQ